MHPPRPTAPTPKHAAAHRPTTPPPFPQIRGEHMERLFFSAPPHDSVTCKVCHRQRVATSGDGDATSDGDDIREQVRTKVPSRRDKEMRKAARDALPSPLLDDDDEEANNDGRQWDTKWRREARKLGVPPQTVVARVIRELEDDFTHYKSIYVELADTYKVLDAASNVPKRNLVAKHLKEVVDILEAKGDQIAALYDLLAFK
ncbi:centrosome microtubule-binding domain of Cep57-domain-containing protein [Flagelloscypha sp. PMI_526]|nr:centrosome microtubule-binding domain of Cep57-domain-containing protein [Flagelloscypha sp. PMI_526]